MYSTFMDILDPHVASYLKEDLKLVVVPQSSEANRIGNKKHERDRKFMLLSKP